ncbi:MAG: poly-gamma-glutamate synthase PgsB [Acidobacteriota bacterium]
MSSFAALSTLLGILLVLVRLEYLRHQRRIYGIPHRIHVNGTRGKSSVTRLIGAGLRAGGLRTITKVTGTFPRLILADGSDVPIHRKAAATILEQIGIVDFAVRQGAEALVIECMALEPDYQRITEQQMIHATLGVLTNVRLDHTDVMGRTLPEIGASMAKTMPEGGTVVTGEQEHLPLVRQLAQSHDAELIEARAEEARREDMDGFRYIEHRENVALALSVCAQLGVERDVALRGMWEAEPDAGVLTRSRVSENGSTATFFNAFAANDPGSTLMVWRKLRDEGHLAGQRFVLLNSRADRKDRSEQLAHLVATELGAELDSAFVMGEPTEAVARWLKSYGLPPERIVDLGHAPASEVSRAILQRTEVESSVVAIGNMGGHGAATAEWFEARSQ